MSNDVKFSARDSRIPPEFNKEIFEVYESIESINETALLVAIVSVRNKYLEKRIKTLEGRVAGLRKDEKSN